MTLAINTTTPEGQVLAADSRQSYKNQKGQMRIGSESGMKVFRLSMRAGAATAGMGFLDGKNISQHIKDLVSSQDLNKLNIEQIANVVYDHFLPKYQALLTQATKNAQTELEKQGNKEVNAAVKVNCLELSYKDAAGKQQTQTICYDALQFLVAGYDQDKKAKVFQITIPLGKKENGIQSMRAEGQSGATWVGQTDVITRIVRGWGSRVKQLESIQKLGKDQKDKILDDLDKQEYMINWGTMTLQDAVDFCTLAIKTTEAIQRFSDGTAEQPGDFPGVGGKIDIAVITPDKGFVWIRKKALRTEGTEIDLESMKDI